jgi:hypothetical protein
MPVPGHRPESAVCCGEIPSLTLAASVGAGLGGLIGTCDAGDRQSGGGRGEPPPIAGHEGGFAPASKDADEADFFPGAIFFSG